jgi:hypothetical protein
MEVAYQAMLLKGLISNVLPQLMRGQETNAGSCSTASKVLFLWPVHHCSNAAKFLLLWPVHQNKNAINLTQIPRECTITSMEIGSLKALIWMILRGCRLYPHPIVLILPHHLKDYMPMLPWPQHGVPSFHQVTVVFCNHRHLPLQVTIAAIC